MASSVPPPDGFPLLSLHPTLFRKVINKFKGKDYFLLRQTCRGVNELIQKNRTICIHLDADYVIGSGCELWHSYPEELVDEEAYYGTRFRKFFPANEFCDVQFETLFNFLRKYRLTCEELILNIRPWTKEECAALIKLLKPIEIDLQSDRDNCDRYRALFDSKTLKNVKVNLKFEDATIAVEKLLPNLEKLQVSVMSAPAPISLLRNVLQLFLSHATHGLKEFDFRVSGDSFDSKDGLEQEFRELNWTHTMVIDGYYEDEEELSATVHLPQHFPSGSSCRIVVNWHYFSFHGSGMSRRKIPSISFTIEYQAYAV